MEDPDNFILRMEDGALEAVSGKTGIFSFTSMERPDNFIFHMEEGALETLLARSAFSLPWVMLSQIAGLMIISISSLLIFVGQTNNNRVYAQALSMDE